MSSDSEEENVIRYGTPLEPYEEDEVPSKKKFQQPAHQFAVDDHGRRRFHGAFTGGFSAGFQNTVGSVEGWKPSTFKSSRAEKAQFSESTSNQSPEASQQHTSAPQEFVAPSPTAATRKRRIRELQSLVDKVDNISKTTGSSNAENEFDIFGRSIASQMKAMPLSLALRAQQKIQNILCDLRIEQLINNSSPMQSISDSHSPAASPTDNGIAFPSASPNYQPTEHIIVSPALSPTANPNSPAHNDFYEYIVSASDSENNSETQSSTITLYGSNSEENIQFIVPDISQ